MRGDMCARAASWSTERSRLRFSSTQSVIGESESDVVAGSGVGVGSVEFALFGGGYAGLKFGDGGERIGRVAGRVAVDGLERGDAVEIGLQDVGRQATLGVVGHGFSGDGSVQAFWL